MKSNPFCLSMILVLAACSPAPAPEPAAPVVVQAPTAPAPEAAPPAEPAKAPTGMPTHPTLVIDTLDDGRFDLAAERGHWVVVNFWATWCKPCLKEMPDLAAFDQARDDVRVIGLAYEEIEAQDMRAFLKSRPAGYPIALLDVYDPPADFDTPRGLPMTYLIAPDGRVAKKFLGPISSKELATAIDEAVAAG